LQVVCAALASFLFACFLSRVDGLVRYCISTLIRNKGPATIDKQETGC
jgi:hypothetical protein